MLDSGGRGILQAHAVHASLERRTSGTAAETVGVCAATAAGTAADTGAMATAAAGTAAVTATITTATATRRSEDGGRDDDRRGHHRHQHFVKHEKSSIGRIFFNPVPNADAPHTAPAFAGEVHNFTM
jgi:hypothetical protein